MKTIDNMTYNGTCIFFLAKKGYGFIQWDKDGEPQTDIFVYYSDLCMNGFKIIKKGQKVSFNLGLNHRGQLKAVNVVIEA